MIDLQESGRRVNLHKKSGWMFYLEEKNKCTIELQDEIGRMVDLEEKHKRMAELQEGKWMKDWLH